MIDFLKQCLWKNFAACIDMLGNAIAAWPDEYWNTNTNFFYNAYHCIVFLDYYLTIPLENFSSPFPYTLTESENIPVNAIDDVVPDKIYTKNELISYVALCREKCRLVINGLNEENISMKWIAERKNTNLDLASSASLNYSVLEILLYNMRHVQHHAAQLNLLLRQIIQAAPDYVSEAADHL